MNAWRLALGTLTALPVRTPASVDRRTAGHAMVLAPLVGVVLAVPPAILVFLLGWSPPVAVDLLASPLLVAALVLVLLASTTRALHLDGLADTVDGLGSGRPADEALAIMRKSDIGPFGVVALLLVLLVQVAALAQCIGAGYGATSVLMGLLASRGALPLLCTSAFPAARADGLGALVAGCVGRGQALLAALLTAGLGVLGVLLTVDPGWVPTASPVWLLLALPVGLLAALLLGRRMVARLGGMTGDTYGACVEVAFTSALVVAALAT